jgi:hypothetical protein
MQAYELQRLPEKNGEPACLEDTGGPVLNRGSETPRTIPGTPQNGWRFTLQLTRSKST